MEILQYVVGPMLNLCYALIDEETKSAIVVDPAFGSAVVLDDLRSRGLRVAGVVNTHAHLDHVAENARFLAETGAPLIAHEDERSNYASLDAQAAWFGVPPPEPAEPCVWLRDGERVSVGSDELTALHTPGHSPGGLSLLGDGFALVGDVLFAGSIGRADLPGGDQELLISTIRTKLLCLPDETIVYPGHGDPATNTHRTTIGHERRTNPFL